MLERLALIPLLSIPPLLSSTTDWGNKRIGFKHFWQQPLSMNPNKYQFNPFTPLIRCTGVLKKRSNDGA